MLNNLQAEELVAPAPSFLITNLEALKVISDPLRLRIIEVLGPTPKTVKEVAKQLGTTPTKLYYHVNLLEEHGLIQVARTNIVSGIIEKHYQPAALEFRVDRALLSIAGPDGENNAEGLLSTVLDGTKDDIHASLRAGVIETTPDAPAHRTLRMGRMYTRLTPEQAEAFSTRLLDLQKEFSGEEDEAEEETASAVYAFTFALFPMLEPVTSSEDEDDA